MARGASIIAVLFVIGFVTALGLQGYEKYAEVRAFGAFSSYVHEARQLTDAWREPPPPENTPLPAGYSIRLSGPYAELLKGGAKGGTVLARDLYTRRLIWSDFEDGRDSWYCPTWRRCYWQSGDGYADKGYLHLRGYGWSWAVALKDFSIPDSSDIREMTLRFAWKPVWVPPRWGFYDFRAYLLSDGRWYLLKRGYCRASPYGQRCWGVRPNQGWQEVRVDITPYLGKNMRVAFYERAYPPLSYLYVDNVAVTVEFGER